MPKQVKPNEESGKAKKQAKLTGFGAHSTKHKVSREASTSPEAGGDVDALGQSSSELTGAKEKILMAVGSLKSKKDLADCAEWIAQAEIRVSTVEDGHAELRGTVRTLAERNKALEEKVIDMETRS